MTSSAGWRCLNHREAGAIGSAMARAHFFTVHNEVGRCHVKFRQIGVGEALQRHGRGQPSGAIDGRLTSQRALAHFMNGSEKELGELMGLFFITEPSRDSRNALFSMMAIEQMEAADPGATISEMFARLPAEMGGMFARQRD